MCVNSMARGNNLRIGNTAATTIQTAYRVYRNRRRRTAARSATANAPSTPTRSSPRPRRSNSNSNTRSSPRPGRSNSNSNSNNNFKNASNELENAVNTARNAIANAVNNSNVRTLPNSNSRLRVKSIVRSAIQSNNPVNNKRVAMRAASLIKSRNISSARWEVVIRESMMPLARRVTGLVKKGNVMKAAKTIIALIVAVYLIQINPRFFTQAFKSGRRMLESKTTLAPTTISNKNAAWYRRLISSGASVANPSQARVVDEFLFGNNGIRLVPGLSKGNAYGRTVIGFATQYLVVILMLTYSMLQWDTPYAKQFVLITLQVLKTLLKEVFINIIKLMIEETKGKSQLAGIGVKTVVAALAGAAAGPAAGAITAGGLSVMTRLR